MQVKLVDMLLLTLARAREVEDLCKIRVQNFVAYSGPIPGWKAGIYGDQAGKILITSSPKIIEARPGAHPTIARIFRGLFSDSAHPDQQLAVMSWLKAARQNVKDGQRRPLPALAMVGPINCGKSLALEIFKLALGGRSVPAYRALTSEGGFNGALLDAELLVVDDEVASRDHRARTRFAQSIKSTLFAGAVGVTRKFGEQFTCRPVHTLAIACNDEADHIQILPILDDSLSDKISLIRAGRADLHDDETRDREALMATIVKEMPGFLAWLEAFEIPENLRDSRTKARAWQHPAVVALLCEISPESSLRELLSQCNSISIGDPWTGSAAEVQRLLLDDQTTRAGARSLLSWPAACGVYLGRLADSQRGVSRAGRSNGSVQKWEVTE